MSKRKRISTRRLAWTLGPILAVSIAGDLIVLGPWQSDKSGRQNDSSRLIGAQWVQIYYDPSSPDTGLDGDVTIIAFLDYACADCRAAARALQELREKDRGVRLVFKELPMTGSSSDFAVRAALAADRQDKFLSLHRELLQGPWPPSESSVIMAAVTAGLDIEQLRTNMGDPAIAKAIKENRALARALGVTSLPAFIIGNRIYRGAADPETLQAAVAQARKSSSW